MNPLSNPLSATGPGVGVTPPLFPQSAPLAPELVQTSVDASPPSVPAPDAPGQCFMFCLRCGYPSDGSVPSCARCGARRCISCSE